ncbi:MAG TPA: DUF2793 domain-containing protein [Aliiroseovarius sp.]|nr:DUF2793 domain-containing protein [Aliiroseovarius sp.]
MSDTPNLALPLIESAQAQKHVTHNEALRTLDTLVQLAVVSKDQTTPPGAPVDGESHIVPTGATGAWAGQAGKLAVWQDTAWIFHAPKEGWTAWVADIDRQWSFDGTAWVQTTPPPDFQNIPMLGINTTADATNRLSVASPATLLNNEGAGHQLKINKNATADTASLLFQSGWTGHAEMGLAGADDFTVKTSDGTSWFAALKCNAADGRVSFPAGLTGRVEVFDTGNSVFIGEGAGASDDLSDNENVFIGYLAGSATTTGYGNVAIGANAMRQATTARLNMTMGGSAAESLTTGSYNMLIGGYAGYSLTTGNNNVYIGYAAGEAAVIGDNNTGMGRNSLRNTSTGYRNSAYGRDSLYSNTTGHDNAGFGVNAIYANTTGTYNTAVGVNALFHTTSGGDNTSFTNCTGLGYDTRVSGSNQVQLGNSSTTTYAYGAVQDRSDMRDKADIRDTMLGLDFITRLRPVDFRWDMRDDYFDEVEEVDPETGEVTTRLVPVEKDGSRKRGRFHHGLIAQEVAAVIKETGVDFGGYQDHNFAGDGEDVLSIGYSELIAPLIRAVQEMAAEIADLKAQISR